ncbi:MULTISPECIES: DUF5789 family protein [Anaerotruncus]|jgi:hypothetical protein|uniref:Uncharacterized protein n=1 Tax=Anaerotruncus colihominis TaxID=169435 RepID=A0A845SLG7_9FIRM|nr:MULTISPECIES: hypothetical protein [Anaerotruncus]MCI8492614.1 hypothetical protein [Anaerotruncus sp.]MCR2027076.1 hypothetical protein [Anaerotruncus colihominis]NBI78564.1 hypothetical protein [Anaerotruncus colihominis]NDO37649.1 hypothetical protein [Anaerotruncus colihominis]
MTKDAYPAMFHFLHRQLADIQFPITKEQLLEQAGDRMVCTDWDRRTPLRELIEPVAVTEYSCAAQFYCALLAAIA